MMPLPVTPWPITDVDQRVVYGVLDRLNPPFAVSIVEGVPGSPGRILSLGAVPYWICDYYPVIDEETLYAGVWWVLDPSHEDERAVGMAEMLGMKEVFEDE